MTASAVLQWLREHQSEQVAHTRALAELESPSSEPAAQGAMFEALARFFIESGLVVTRVPGGEKGDHLYARPPRRNGQPWQLVVGHLDTVWPVGTLAKMPVHEEDGQLHGPGVFDMKSGLVMVGMALRALAAVGVPLAVTPVVFVNSDEEIGSRSSTRHLRRLSRGADRALVLEPPAGLDGRLKTARKGVGRFTLTVHGRASHAGLAPEQGVSAILELSHQIQALFALNDLARGISVNVGTIDGGLRSNVVAPESTAVIDVRVPTAADAERITRAIEGLQPITPGASLTVTGGIGRPPMEVTPGGTALWQLARRLGEDLGLHLAHAHVGGGSDGNTTSQYTATLDGLGAVGEGAHAAHEHIVLDALAERTALLALLLAADPLEVP